MGIPRKRSRLIDVDGKPFRYFVKETHIDDHRDQLELSVTVQEEAERPGRVLQFRSPYGIEVTPEAVRETVRVGLQKGWDPASRGSAFTLKSEETAI